MHNPFNTGAGHNPVTLIDKMVGETGYRDIRALAQIVEEIKHLARYMPQLYRLYNLTKDLSELSLIFETGLPVQAFYAVQTNNLYEGQTEFVVPGGYVPNQVIITVNGQRLNNSDFTATNEKSFILKTPVIATDIVEIVGTRSGLIKLTTLQDTLENINKAVSFRVSTADNNLIQNQTIITVPGGYRPHTILVFKNGQVLKNTDYDDSSGTTVNMKDPLDIDDIIDIRGNSMVTPPNKDDSVAPKPNISIRISTADGNLTVGQSVIQIPGGFVPGTPLVFLDGNILSNKDYDDSSGSQIVLNFGLTANNILDIRGQQASLPAQSNIYVNNIDFVTPINARTVFYYALTEPHTVTLPPIELFPESTFLTIGDSSGNASETKYINIIPNNGDSIAQVEEALQIVSPDTAVRFIRGSNRKWISL